MILKIERLLKERCDISKFSDFVYLAHYWFTVSMQLQISKKLNKGDNLKKVSITVMSALHSKSYRVIWSLDLGVNDAKMLLVMVCVVTGHNSTI